MLSADVSSFAEERAVLLWEISEVVAATGGRTTLPERLVVHSVVTDSRAVRPGALFVALRGEHFDGHDFIDDALRAGAVAALCERPGTMPEKCIVVPDTVRALGDLAGWTRRREGWRVVGITGSTGKTTTKELTAAVCSAGLGDPRLVLKTRGNWNNWIGLPLTILGASGEERVAVLEMGMNRPGEIRRLAQIAQPNVGVITNIGLAHAEGVGGTIAHVARAKGELLEELGEEEIFVLNLDDEWACRIARQCRARCVTFGKGGDVQAHWIRDLGPGGVKFQLNIRGERTEVHLPLVGVHNVSNALAAAAVGLAMGFRVEDIASGLCGGGEELAGRMQVERLRNGVTVIDDSYNANPSSVEAALRALCRFSGRRLVVLAEMRELGGESRRAHRAIGEYAASLEIARLVLYGPLTQAVAEGARDAGFPPEQIVECGSHEEAVRAVVDFWQPGDTVLVKGSHSLHMEEVVRTLREIGNQ